MKRDVEAERARIDQSIAGKTLLSVFAETVKAHPEAKALSWRTDQGWQSLTWEEYRQKVREVAPLCMMALSNKPDAAGIASKAPMEKPPADSPKTVTLLGSPPKTAIWVRTQCNAAT